MVNWQESEVEGHAAWTGETGLISVCVIPGLGAKAISLRSRRTGREWLWRSGKPLGNEGYGSSFAAGDESGWDEMFPGIDACGYPLPPWEGRPVPDHGEVWALRWRHCIAGTALHCAVEGVEFPYLLEKVYSFASENILRIDYTLTNRSEAPFSFLWAAHPLLRIRQGMRLLVPDGLDEIEVAFSAEQRLGAAGDKRPWPLAEVSVGTADLSMVEAEKGRFAEKYYFTGRLKTGFAGIRDPATGEALTFSFPAGQVPYLAVWANYGGFGGNYQLALEPATGRMDSLARAVRRGGAAEAGPGSRYRWYLEVKVDDTN
ncbi:hypothetical protein [Paenibacillus sp. S150]|uniref:hypothetical protein n=1 Tax=Paenibacillus sp. S150 TaxID=2749826 RepID=UPI001C5680FF|nr:hypothetical protein [Paenibacillus sp. S150]MBW4082476.1 hypothetical protein [Paenibacillus sp. S150]